MTDSFLRPAQDGQRSDLADQFTELRAALQKVVDHAKTKTPCASNYQCLLADLMNLIGESSHE